MLNPIGKLKHYKSSEIDESYVSIGFECLDRELWNPDKCYDLLAESGVKHARVQTGWVRCEKEKGVYDFSWLDEIVDNLVARGIRPWFDVGFGNPLYMKNTPNEYCVGCVPLLFGDEAVEAWKNFVTATVRHFKDRITYFEIWNEPDIPAFWYPGNPDAKMCAELVKMTAVIIKREHTTAKTGINMSNAVGNPAFLDRFLENISPDFLDFFCCHLYQTMPEIESRRFYNDMRIRLDSHGFTDTEIWQGEAGYPSWAYKGHWLVNDGCDDERAQAVYQLRRYFIDISCGAKISSFFQMADMWEKPYPKARDVISKPAAHGILHGKTYIPKESYRTISNLASLFSGDIKPKDEFLQVYLKKDGKCEYLQAEQFTFEKNGKPIYAYYYATPLDYAEELPYTATVKIYGTLQNPVLADMYTGEAFEISDCRQYNGVTELNNLPVKNYPMVIAEKFCIETV